MGIGTLERHEIILNGVDRVPDFEHAVDGGIAEDAERHSRSAEVESIVTIDDEAGDGGAHVEHYVGTGRVAAIDEYSCCGRHRHDAAVPTAGGVPRSVAAVPGGGRLRDGPLRQ